jgi:hypothetical protein
MNAVGRRGLQRKRLIAAFCTLAPVLANGPALAEELPRIELGPIIEARYPDYVTDEIKVSPLIDQMLRFTRAGLRNGWQQRDCRRGVSSELILEYSLKPGHEATPVERLIEQGVLSGKRAAPTTEADTCHAYLLAEEFTFVGVKYRW